MQKVVLPRLFENMEEGTIGRWLVSIGSEVSVGTPLCEIITEKTTLELPSEVAGFVRQLVAPEKAVVPPGFVLALVGEADEPLVDVSRENAALSGAGLALQDVGMGAQPAEMIGAAWKEVMDTLQSELSDPTFQNYLRDVRPLRLTSDRLTLSVPSEFVKDWLMRRFERRMEETLEEFLGHPVILAFQIVSPEENASPAPAPAPSPSSGGRLRATPAARRAAKDAGVELEEVAAKFPGKVLSEDDVKRFAGESK